MKSCRWFCRPCRRFGYGGPEGAEAHLKTSHEGVRHHELQSEFGFTRDYTTRLNGVEGFEIQQPRMGDR